MMPTHTKKRISAADLKIEPFDAAAYLTTPERIADFLDEVVAGGEIDAIQQALGIAARATGMAQIARTAGLSRENLYRALSPPHEANFSTMVRVADALGLELTFRPKRPRSPRKVAKKRAGGG